jgi:hypothetical protein
MANDRIGKLAEEAINLLAVIRQNSATAACLPCSMLHSSLHVAQIKCVVNSGKGQATQSFRPALDLVIAPPSRKARSCGEHS